MNSSLCNLLHVTIGTFMSCSVVPCKMQEVVFFECLVCRKLECNGETELTVWRNVVTGTP